jgi:hypothetical protein
MVYVPAYPLIAQLESHGTVVLIGPETSTDAPDTEPPEAVETSVTFKASGSGQGGDRHSLLHPTPEPNAKTVTTAKMRMGISVVIGQCCLTDGA